MPHCSNCDRHVSVDYARVFAERDGTIPACPGCRDAHTNTTHLPPVSRSPERVSATGAGASTKTDTPSALRCRVCGWPTSDGFDSMRDHLLDHDIETDPWEYIEAADEETETYRTLF